jgi:hypothetical protein
LESKFRNVLQNADQRKLNARTRDSLVSLQLLEGKSAAPVLVPQSACLKLTGTGLVEYIELTLADNREVFPVNYVQLAKSS